MSETITVIFGDLHAGSRTAIFPRSYTIDDMLHKPGLPQRQLHDYWRKCWQDIGKLREGKRLVIIGIGDYIDGYHHETTELITSNIGEQERIASYLIDEAMQLASFDEKDTLYMLGGTPSHDGNNWQNAESIAYDLGAKPYKEHKERRQARYIWPRLLGNIDGILFDVLHEGFTVGRRIWTKTNGMRSILQHVYLSRIEDKQPIPRLMISGHIHRYAHERYGGKLAIIDGYTCPSWQLKTTYGTKAAKYDLLSDIGLLVFCGCEEKHMILEYQEQKAVTL